MIKIIQNIKKFQPDLILAIGGGSVLDYAKIANVLANSENIISEIKHSNYEIKKFTKLVAIPTTAGSGAEVTSNAVIYIDNIKYSIENDKLIPDYFFSSRDIISGSKK